MSHRDDELPSWQGAFWALGVVLMIFALATLAVFMLGCGFKIPPCVLDGSCLPRPTVTATATATSTAAPTSTEIPTATATPAAPSAWTTRLVRVQGFAGCNPGQTGRTSCHGDRTFWFTMPGFDIVPKGAGCETAPNPGACRARDSAGTPCGGAPACDQDHMGCERNRVGCNGHGWDDPRGSVLKATGQIQCTEAADHYGFDCSGTPGASYMLCARPFADAHTADGTPILVQGTGEFCASGLF